MFAFGSLRKEGAIADDEGYLWAEYQSRWLETDADKVAGSDSVISYLFGSDREFSETEHEWGVKEGHVIGLGNGEMRYDDYEEIVEVPFYRLFVDEYININITG